MYREREISLSLSLSLYIYIYIYILEREIHKQGGAAAYCTYILALRGRELGGEAKEHIYIYIYRERERY